MKNLLIVAICVLLALSLAACGCSVAEDTKPTTTTPATQAPTTAPTIAPTTPETVAPEGSVPGGTTGGNGDKGIMGMG